MDNDHIRYVIDAGAAATIVGTLAGWVPVIAAVFAILWYAVQIWESKTVRGLRARFRRSGPAGG